MPSVAPSPRTYIITLDGRPDFSAAAASTMRTERKVAAARSMQTATNATLQSLQPTLDALRSAGVIKSETVLPYVGSLLVTTDVEDAARLVVSLQGSPGVTSIRRDRTFTAVAEVGSEVLAVAPATTEPNVERVNAPAAWEQGARGQGATIGSIDTGVDISHEALRDRYRGRAADGSVDHNHNWFDMVLRKPEPYDDRRHGTHTVGTAVGSQAVGVAPAANFIAARGLGPKFETKQSDLLAALNWMVAPTDLAGANADPTKAPDILTNSWGYIDAANELFRPANQALAAAGILQFFAAGNDGPRAQTLRSPAAYPEVVAVAATDNTDRLAQFSSRGPGPFKDANGTPIPKPDLAAPGVNVTSARAGKTDAYTTMSGTSMAAPAAAGVAALVLSKFPNLSAAQLREVLLGSAADLGEPGHDALFGAGRVDAAAALARAQAMSQAAAA